MHRKELIVRTPGRGFIELTQQIDAWLVELSMREGLCNVFLPHTSASLLLGENWDASVRRDLESFMQRLAPDADPRYEHDAEGADDMPAHIRAALTQSSVVLPVAAGRLRLGTWQGIYLWEHRIAAHERRVLLTAW
ncbi:MAG TPA: secondary thiamine-phosphate synthase enzyme YjbQ [Steroidobacteraceae bacterium]|nr:secondary thiamine-phosphate synthase enzyme YjbQ [Steroidobacteraceae bacterium]